MNYLWYFMIGCIGARLLLAFLAKQAPLPWLKWMGVMALVPAAVFFYLFWSGTRKGTGTFGQTIWWAPLRPIHALLYFMFAVFAIQGKREAWVFLLLDILVGTIGFFYVHIKQDDFRSLL